MLIDVLESIFGDYTPVSYPLYNQVTEQWDVVIPSGAAGVDWQYVAGVILFAVCLYGVLRILGGVLRG